MDIEVQRLSYELLRREADDFLRQYHPSGEVPVPIEQIVEFQFDMDIVPEPGLHEHFVIDSYITADLKEIRIDEFVYESRPGRYRFSLAHELGHRVLHQYVFSALTFNRIADWKQVIATTFSDKQYGYLEWQASSFAGLILVPVAELAVKYDEVCRLVQQHGLSLQALQEDSEVAQSLISGHIADHFVVSSTVVRRRLEYDGIWRKSG